jgi:hypothetical protein
MNHRDVLIAEKIESNRATIEDLEDNYSIIVKAVG